MCGHKGGEKIPVLRFEVDKLLVKVELVVAAHPAVLQKPGGVVGRMAVAGGSCQARRRWKSRTG